MRLDSICSQVPPKFDEQLHGCHRWCYKNFTNVSKFAVPESENDVSDSEETSFSVTPTGISCRTPRTASSSDVTSPAALYPRHDCIFCHKGRKKVKGSYENLSTCVTETAENSIKQAAQHKLDYALFGVISDMDLHAREARYHESCRKAYVTD